jgi:hypothetical protein
MKPAPQQRRPFLMQKQAEGMRLLEPEETTKGGTL